jgi:hypothetical protein
MRSHEAEHNRPPQSIPDWRRGAIQSDAITLPIFVTWVLICRERHVFAERGPIGVPAAVSTIDPQGQHMVGVCYAPPRSKALEALLSNVAMGAFYLSRVNRQVIGQSLAIVQLVAASAQIAMASPHGSLVVVHARASRWGASACNTLFTRPVLRVHPRLLRGGGRRNRFDGRAQIFK